ncbi:unnamed protein product [Discula destructiva]
MSAVGVLKKLQRLRRPYVPLPIAQRRTYRYRSDDSSFDTTHRPPPRRPLPSPRSPPPTRLPPSHRPHPSRSRQAQEAVNICDGSRPLHFFTSPPQRSPTRPRQVVHSLLFYQSDPRPNPVNPIDIPPAQSNYNRPMLAYVQIVSVPTADTPGAVLVLHFDGRRYAFGQIAEGTQRVFNQRKVGLAKLDELFVSGPVQWSSTGGLMGMILTIADVVGHQNADDSIPQPPNKQKKKAAHRVSHIQTLKIHGGENITHMIATARKFIFRKGLPLRLHEIEHDPGTTDPQARKPDFEDQNVMVWYVSLLPGHTAPHGRKRSHEDMEADDAGGQSSRAENKKLVQSVIDHMFDSNWNLDAMMETTLHQVKLPATVFVRKDGKTEKYEGPMPGHPDCKDIPVLIRTPWPGGQIRDLPSTTPSKQSLSYIVKAHSRRGKFNVAVATELEVAKTDFKHLAAGKSVKGKGGMDVTPDMCVDPTIPGRGFAFIDLPDLSYVDAFLARPEWENETIMSTVDAMYWNLGRDVLHDGRIQGFMRARQSKHHSVFSPDISPNRIAMESPAVATVKMHTIDPDRFPLPVFDNRVLCSSPDKTFQEGRIFLKQQLAPREEMQEDEVVPMDITKGKNVGFPHSVTKMARKAQARAQSPSFLAAIEATEADIPNRDAEVIALGTGSSLPSKYRNVSATLVRIPGAGSYLFDAGESTLGQLRRMYGPAKADEILADLKCIWISHLHADHHLGTASVIRAWRDVTAAAAASPDAQPDQLPRLLVASHINMLDWLREYADVEDYGYTRILPIAIRGPPRPNSAQEPFILDRDLATKMGGLTRIDACRVDHCSGALACVFTWGATGLRIAYSGDCRPSSTFAAQARGATLLIHEATLDDELQGDAFAKRHCTMSEALGIARDMRARRVLLTHFSQRYPRIPNRLVVEDEGEGEGEGEGKGKVKDQVVLLAFDQTCVRLGDFKKAELFLPALREMLDRQPEGEDA